MDGFNKTIVKIPAIETNQCQKCYFNNMVSEKAFTVLAKPL